MLVEGKKVLLNTNLIKNTSFAFTFDGLYVTSWRPCWCTVTIRFFSCKLYEQIFFYFVHQHGGNTNHPYATRKPTWSVGHHFVSFLYQKTKSCTLFHVSLENVLLYKKKKNNLWRFLYMEVPFTCPPRIGISSEVGDIFFKLHPPPPPPQPPEYVWRQVTKTETIDRP